MDIKTLVKSMALIAEYIDNNHGLIPEHETARLATLDGKLNTLLSIKEGSEVDSLIAEYLEECKTIMEG